MANADGIKIDNTSDLRGRYWLTRFVFLRWLGLIYFVAFLSLAQQVRPLIGAHGLLPAASYLDRIGERSDRLSAFLALPTIFWVDCSDSLLTTLAYVGVGGSALVLLGFANVPLLALLWFLYLSFVHVGQLFWGYGWEILLLEVGFLAIFLCPLFDPRPFADRRTPPVALIWLIRWMLFRVMLGAGLIKWHGDPCWRDLTCMLHHYETQPLPNPLSWYFHFLPPAVHRFEVLVNHFVELLVPWTLIAPRRIRQIGGGFFIGFQVLLILSGNLVWLNWLTLALCIACFDDHAVAALLPARWRQRVTEMGVERPSRPRQVTTFAYAALVAYLSIGPVGNLMGSRQIMNGSFDRLHLVNTYGAFGSVGKQRNEIILEGTSDESPSESSQWLPYEFKCKPGDVTRRPCVVAPFHYRVDWQIWFAAMEDPRANPWLVHFIYKLLQGDADALGLLATNPFPDRPPRFIRAELYEYDFTKPDDTSGAWWQRRYVGSYFPPLALDNTALRRFIASYGWPAD